MYNNWQHDMKYNKRISKIEDYKCIKMNSFDNHHNA